MSELKVLRNKSCGTVFVAKVNEGKGSCDLGNFEVLTVNTTEAATEKHLPVVVRENGKIIVKVGSVAHPMSEEHYIEFIILETEKGFRVSYLKPGDAPEVVVLDDEPVTAVYAYCNLHGLWMTKS